MCRHPADYFALKCASIVCQFKIENLVHKLLSIQKMGCCCSKDGSDTDSLDDPLIRDSDSGSIANSRYEDERIGPTGENFPTWVMDEEARLCFNCDIKFHSITERKHHCRRCRNVFCTGCSAHKAAIASYGIEEEVRVCEACKSELQTENFYFKVQKPLLVRGENFKRYKMMGMTSYIVKLRLLDEHALVYDGDLKPEPEEIRLAAIQKITMSNLTTFELVTPAKSWSFEADSITTLKTWTEALNLAVRMAKEPPIRARVEEDRRKKIEYRRKSKDDHKKAKVAQSTKEKRTEALTSIKERYSAKK